MRRRATLVGDPKIQECYREMFFAQTRQTVKLLLVVILMTNIQGIFGVTVGNGNVFSGEVNGNRPIGNGSYTKANGEKYTGYFEDGMMKGQFMVEYPSGNVYRGDVDEDGTREGKGVINYASGSYYEGGWRGGDQHGQGVYTWPDGSKFEGEWRGGDKHGQGVYTWPDGERYEGEWRRGNQHGQGVKTWPSGSRYEGDWRDDKRTGQGIYYYADGNKYEGDFKDGDKHGQGVYTWAGGDRYEGDWRDDKRTGQGIYYYADGNKYEGDFKDGDKHGQGVYTWPSGSRYEGDWRDDKMTGQGIYYYADGNKYEGDFKDGDKHGQGVYTWAGGDRYEGEWRDGEEHGHGVYTWSSESKEGAGTRYEGEWRDGNRTGWGRYIYKNYKNFVEYDGEFIDGNRTGYGKVVYKDRSIYNGQWTSNKREGQGLFLWPNGTCFYGQMKNDKIFHGMTMTPDLVFTYPPYKNTTYNGKGFKVVNFTGGEIDCFNEDGFESCYNSPNDTDTLYFGSPEHYYFGDTITVRKRKIIRKIMDGFGELGLDGGYYIGEMKHGMQTGFGLKSEPFSATLIGTFKAGIMEGTGASISFSFKHRTVYLGGYKKGQPDGPGIFIYPDGEKVLGYFIEGKLDHSKNPIYLHPDGTRDSLVPTSG